MGKLLPSFRSRDGKEVSQSELTVLLACKSGQDKIIYKKKVSINMFFIEFKPSIFASNFLFHLNWCKTRPGIDFFVQPWALFTFVSAMPLGQYIWDRKKAFLPNFVKWSWQPILVLTFIYESGSWFFLFFIVYKVFVKNTPIFF